MIKSQVANWLLIIILLVAAFLRLYRLDESPPGLTHDEADFTHDAIEVYYGARPIYVATYGYQDEPLMHYASALVMSVVGPSYLAVRATSALFGIILILLTFLWARTAFGPAVALSAAACLSVSYWPVATSRFALQVEPIASIMVFGNLFFWMAMGLGRRKPTTRGLEMVYWLLFTLCLVASIYAYEASRISWILFPVFGLYLLIVHPNLFRQNWWKIVLALIFTALFSLPLLTHPAAWDRASKLAGPLEALSNGDLGPLLNSIVDVLALFTFKGDPFVTYNLPGRPILDPITGLLFYGGILLCLWRWRKPAWIFALLWLVTGVAPSLLTGAHSASLRSVVAKPAVYIIVALSLVDLVGWLTRRFGFSAKHLLLVGLLLVMIGDGLVTYRDYFVCWVNAAETKAAYFSDVFQAIRYLDTNYSGCSVLLSSPFPTLPHDPYIADVMPTRHDMDVRWVDGRRALVFPDSSCVSLAVLSRASLDGLLEDELEARHITRVPIKGSEEYFDVFKWEPGGTLASLQRLYGYTTQGADEHFALPVDFGDSVRLVGYSVEPSPATPGDVIRLVTMWQVRDPEALGPVPAGFYGHDVAIFVHVLDGDAQIVAQEDRLDAPAWNWRQGDSFVQIHYLATDPTLSPGLYNIEVGMFTRPGHQRLSVSFSDGTEGDHVLLEPLEVVSP